MQPPSPPPLSLSLSLSFFLSLLLLLMEKLSPSPLPTHRRTEQKLIPQTWYNSASYSIISDLWSEKDTWIFVWAGPLHHCLETRVCQHWSFLEEKKVILSFNPVSSDSGSFVWKCYHIRYGYNETRIVMLYRILCIPVLVRVYCFEDTSQVLMDLPSFLWYKEIYIIFR